MRAPSAPTLRTDRLTLRAHRIGDFADMLAMWRDAEVARFIGGRPMGEEEVWARLLRYAGHWAMLGYGFWCICETQSERFVGEAGLFEAHRALEPGFGGAPEIGWALAPQAHGRGYGREAVAAVVAWGDAELKAPRTACMIAPDNSASIRLAERLGYAAFADTEHHGQPARLFERLAPVGP